MKCLDFQKKVKIQMTRKSLKICDLAKIMNCSSATISKWREGNVPPSPDKQYKLAEALDISFDELFFEIHGKLGPIFSNSCEHSDPDLRHIIEKHMGLILNEAQECPGGLEHMYVEILKRFPLREYKNIAKRAVLSKKRIVEKIIR